MKDRKQLMFVVLMLMVAGLHGCSYIEALGQKYHLITVIKTWERMVGWTQVSMPIE